MTLTNKIQIIVALLVVTILLATSCRKRTDVILITTPDCPGVCENGGECNEQTGYCDCPQGYEGELCQFQRDACFMIDCLNGGECVDGECICEFGWTGPDCSISTIDTISYRPAPILNICPEHINGNSNFSGNGPDVDISVKARIKENKYIFAEITFHLKQTNGNSPTEGLVQIEEMIYQAPSGKEIMELLSSDSSDVVYTDTNRDLDVMPPDSGSLVREFRVMGDTNATDFPNDCINDGSKLDVHFNDLLIWLIDPQ